MKRNRARKVVHAILAIAVMFSLTVSDMFIFRLEGAHAQKSLRGKGTYGGNDSDLSLMDGDGSGVEPTGEGFAPAPPPRPLFDAPWSANVKVNNDLDGADQRNPAIAVDPSGNAYAVWEDNRNGDWDIYFSFRPSGGNWHPNVKVNDDTAAAQQLSPSIAVDPAGNAQVVWADDRNDPDGVCTYNDCVSDIYFSYRPSGGSWGPNVRVNDVAGSAHDPEIAADGVGNAYVVWVDRRSSGHPCRDKLGPPQCNVDIYFSYRPSGGSWGPNVQVNDNAGTANAPSIAADAEGNAYAAWIDYRNDPDSACDILSCEHDIYVSERRAGADWGLSERVSDETYTVGSEPALEVGALGDAVVVWSDNRRTRGGHQRDIYFDHRDARGNWHGNNRVNSQQALPWVQPHPSLAVRDVSNVCVGWADARNDHNNAHQLYPPPDVDIYVTCRRGRGNWGHEYRVNDDPGISAQTGAVLAMDGMGNVYAAWEDSRNGDTDVYFSYWQLAPHANLSELLQQKQSTIQSLSQVGYDEQPSRGLVGTLEAEAAEGWLASTSEFSAVQRLVLTEELLANMYPHYARSSADTGEALTSFLFIMLGFWKALDTVETNLPDSIYSGAAKALIAKIKNKLIDFIHHVLEFIEYRYVPHDFRPTFHNLSQILWAYAKAHIMDPDDPFGPGGEALMTTLADPELGIGRDNVLLSHYRGQTQPLVDAAVHTADPNYTDLDRFEVHPTDEGAKLQMEWVINQVEIWSDHRHAAHEDLKRGANMAGLAADIADLASLSGVLAPIAQAVARAADGIDAALAFLRGGQSFLFLVCLQQSAQDGQVRIYDPSTHLEMPPACEMSKRLGLFTTLRGRGGSAYLFLQLLNQMQQESEDYQELLQDAIVALEQEDRDTLAELVPKLLQADDDLSRAIDLTDAAIFATADDHTSEQLFSQGAAFDLATITLYAYLVDALLVPEEASLTAARNQALTVGSSLDSFRQLTGMMQIAPSEREPMPILLISSISSPQEITVDREFTVGVEVANVGAVPARETTLVVGAEEGIEPRETTAPLGSLRAESTRTVTLRLTPRREGPSLLTLTLSSQDGGSVSRLALVEVAQGEEPPTVMRPTRTLWPWLAGLGLLALIFVSLVGLRWRLRRPTEIVPEAIVKLCPNCGAGNVAAARFCIKCGRALTG